MLQLANLARSRLSSSRSAVLKPSLLGNGLPLSMAAWPTQLVMDCAVTLNSRESPAGVCPARTRSTICCLNSAGYGGLTLDLCGSLNTKNDVSTEPGQRHLLLWFMACLRHKIQDRLSRAANSGFPQK